MSTKYETINMKEHKILRNIVIIGNICSRGTVAVVKLRSDVRNGGTDMLSYRKKIGSMWDLLVVLGESAPGKSDSLSTATHFIISLNHRFCHWFLPRHMIGNNFRPRIKE
jgi:hypothetical protein